MSQQNPLHSNFLRFAKLYDADDYKRGLKEVKKLIPSHPKNGELLAWKALFLQGLKQKAEALETANQAVHLDIKCAHVWKYFGMINKEQGNYTKAAQSYTMARKLDPSDPQVLQDLCNLYLYERNYPFYLEVSSSLIQKKPICINVMRYALALELNNHTEDALKFVSTYEGKLIPSPTKVPEELVFRSELSLFHANLLFKLGRYPECLEYFNSNFAKAYLRDVERVSEIRLQCHIKLNNFPAAQSELDYLIHIYPENGDYFNYLEQIISAVHPESSTAQLIDQLLIISQKERSKYALVRALELMDASDSRFLPLSESFIKPLLVKGSPAIFAQIRDFGPAKLNIVMDYLKALDLTQIPISSIPIYHLLLAHIHKSNQNYDAALEEIKIGLDHTPTAVDLYGERVRILKRAGRVEEYVQAAKEFAEADPGDRNSDTMYVMALILNGKIQESIEAAKPFSLDPQRQDRLLASQYNAVHLAIADATARALDFRNAIKGYNDVLTHFEKFRKSQFNYLGWAMKKINSLRDMLKWADDLPKNRVFGKAVAGLLAIHLNNIGNNNELLTQQQIDIKQVAKLGVKTAYPESLAYTAVYYARNNKPMIALKAYLNISKFYDDSKLNDPSNIKWRFLAEKAMIKMIESEEFSKMPQLIKEVVTEKFAPIGKEPEDFIEVLAAAIGLNLVGEKESAAQMLIRAADLFDGNFKNGLRLIKVSKQEMADEQLTQTLKQKITQKYPKMMLEFENYSSFDLLSVKDES